MNNDERLSYIERMKRNLENIKSKKNAQEIDIKVQKNKLHEVLYEIRNEAWELVEGKKSKVKLEKIFLRECDIAEKLNDLKIKLKWIDEEIEELENEIKYEEKKLIGENEYE